MTPPGDLHGAIEAVLVEALRVFGVRAGHGRVRSGESGIVLGRDPDHVLGADAAFIGNDRLPIHRSDEGYLLTIPHLVVEVRSKNDTLAALGRRAQDYLHAGVVVVWVVDPIHRNIIEYRSGVEPRIWAEQDTLTVEDIIPGFRQSVAEVLDEDN
jgi:Uma2 family endonuclease